ncbi:MAG TPA: helix-turn-helix domain-containing protein [Vicinamibacterales bacterium]|nr:helix-turn-helix domain-containing protein [Vicinamibacterales bacterium]
MRLEQETFGPVLRAARERRGVSLNQLALETKLSAELWEALEDGDLSRWPKRILARSYVRDYALRVGLDGDEIVNEFCRLFPEWGDRRAERLIREKAHIIAHDLTWEDLPAPGDRRASDRAAQTAPGFFGRHRERVIAVAVDLAAISGFGSLGVRLGFAAWPSVAVVAVVYSVLATSLIGRSFGMVASPWCLRMLRSAPAQRRLSSSRAESA